MNRGVERPSLVSGEMIGLGGILLVALAIRVVAWSRTVVLFNDGPIFLAMAEAISRGEGAALLHHPFHPLYPLSIALVSALPISLETSAVAVSILGGLLAIVGVFAFVRHAFDQELAWMAAWAVALHPWAVDFSSDVMSDGLYSGLYLMGFASMVRLVERPTVRRAAVCGGWAGAAYLVRPEGAELLIFAAILLVLRSRGAPETRLRAARAGLVLVLSGAVLIAPLILAVGRETGEYALTHKKSLARLALGSEGADLAGRASTRAAGNGRSARGPRVTLPLPESAVRADGRRPDRPARSAGGFVEAIFRALGTSLAAFRFELFGFALVGLWLGRSHRRLTREGAIGLSIVLHSGLLVLLVWGAGYVSRRHAFAVWLPLLGFSALGWRALALALAEHVPGPPGRWLGGPRGRIALLVIVLLLSWGPRDWRLRRSDRAPVRAAAEWLAREHAGSGPVAGQKLRVGYYAKAPFVPLPSGQDGGLAASLRRRGARWIVIDSGKLDHHRGLSEGIGRDFHRVHSEEAAGRRVWVLSIDRKPAR